MGRVSSRDTSLELLIRRSLFASGFRFRLNDKRYPGSPDIVLPKYKAVIFVHGCFWHQHEGCSKSKRPETRREFWNSKLDANIERDKRNIEKLNSLGWRVAIVWECAIKKKSSFEEMISSLEDWIRSGHSELEIPNKT
ncbi:MAG: very short patch repair endonuclease [Zetaproteobacteria bacterium CG12_big_fil_rev_8_21_14_0_65_55_1124]|nr:MAG: very short patch repair endonuclease [Zetaproteobacteria bacterium CG08_land_8_20_14_0_20_55_17]PIW42395.1 MAG: very short patch repair endonuclease [Zetaproteobacteria bacterium CG12_big_fil_rev_8_21_14_0_65_55_1124]PIY52803.1 MAG: very short patch repair endonuclease [Zetaproteobacteria bacterium CG_4_10_14_0_8_um_filter_55_43]PIZ38009.1 MAG: very short patch repair endonuclease [Zetaproteobacteria bacterium CG_4_10_14_0_2_um_filter_55_20]PJB79106.1 MAG: very short patch repair endonu